MVRPLSRILAVALLVLPLSGCIFVLSPFPATLSQVVARTDLSAVIPTGQGWMYHPFIVTPTGGEYVLLMSTNTGMDPVVIVLDSSLNLIQTYSYLTQLSPWGFSGGSVAMTDASGDAVLGSLRFLASDLATVGHFPTDGNLGGAFLDSPSFGSPANGTNEASFTVSGNTLSYAHYLFWAFLWTSALVQINPSGGSYQVEAVYNVDDTPTAGKVVLVLTDSSNSSNVTFVAIPLVNVVNNTVASPLLSSYPSRSYTNIGSSSIGFAGDSLVAYSYDSSSLNRYSLSTFDVISSLPIGKTANHSLEYAYKMTGGYSVVYDAEARTLTKVANWW